MITVTHKQHTLKLWTSMDEMPIDRYQTFNFFVLMDANIGSTAQGIIQHIMRIDSLVAREKNQEARNELANMRQAILFAANKTSPEMAAYAALTYSINGELVTDLSEDGVKAFTKKLSETGWSIRKIRSRVKAVKEQMVQEFAVYWPLRAATTSSKESHGHLKKTGLLKLQEIIEGTNNEKELSRIEEFLVAMYQPEVFWGPNGMEVQFTKQFDEVSTLIAQHVSIPVKSMTAREFYNTLEMLEKQFSKNRK